MAVGARAAVVFGVWLASGFEAPLRGGRVRSRSFPALRSTAPKRASEVVPAAEEDEVSWRRSVTSADFDDALVYRLFRRQFEILLPNLVPKKQLAVSARRGKASLRRLTLNATALNRLFNPLAVDEGFPLQLVRCVCDSVSIAWTSVFTLNRDPLEVRINKIEFEFDQRAARPSQRELNAAANEWNSLQPAPAGYMREYPTVEGSRYLVDEVVCVARRVDAPFPRGGNSTLRLTLRGVDARSVDNASAVADLRRCWSSYNPAPAAAAAFIAKRVVAKEAVLEIKFEDDDEEPEDAPPDDVEAVPPESAAPPLDEAEAAPHTSVPDGVPALAHDEAPTPPLAAAGNDEADGEPSPSDLEDLFPREPPIIDMDPLWLLRRRQSGNGPKPTDWTVRSNSFDFDDTSYDPPKVEFSEAEQGDGFVVLAKAPLPAALLTVGYDSIRADVKSIRVDLDLRRFRLALDSDLLREAVAKPDDVSLGVFALFGDARPGAPLRSNGRAQGGAVGNALSAILNRLVRPAVALFILAWGARLI